MDITVYYQKKARRHIGLLIGSHLVLSIILTTYMSWENVVNNYNPVQMLSGMQITSLAIAIVYSIPLIWRSYNYAKLAQMEKWTNFLRKALVLFIIWSVAMTVCMILALLFPGLFS